MVKDTLIRKFIKDKSRFCLFLSMLLFIFVFTVSFSVGKYPVSPRELIGCFLGKIFDTPKFWSDEIELVIFKIRLPRILGGAIIGAGLSAAGASYQGLFRNPMVSPDLLGASSGAGFGAALSLLLGLNYSLVTLNSFVCGITAVVLTYTISTKVRHNSTLALVLPGIVISSLFTSATSFVKLVADPSNELPAITFWLIGSISGLTNAKISFASVPIAVGLSILFLLRWKINLLTMGEEEAHSMGVNTKLIRLIIVFAATLVTAACVSISGLIGWIGLVIPHCARIIVGYDYRYSLPVTMLLGGSFLMVVDNFARIIVTSEIPIGILTAFIGAPFFLYLIIKRGDEM